MYYLYAAWNWATSPAINLLLLLMLLVLAIIQSQAIQHQIASRALLREIRDALIDIENNTRR
jgi:heme exporter protein D